MKGSNSNWLVWEEQVDVVVLEERSKEQVRDVWMICRLFETFESRADREASESDSSRGASTSFRLDMQKIVEI